MQKLYGFIIITLLLLAGCGNGGSGAGGGAGVQPTIARVTLAAQGTLPAGMALAGIGVTLQLPAGVTPKLNASGAVDSSVITPSGVLANGATVLTPVYTPASGATPGALCFVLASSAANGFGAGEFATVTLNIAPSATAPVAADYSVLSATPIALNGAGVGSLSVTFTAEAL